MTNQHEYKYKYELHAHTAECDLCASVSGGDIVQMYHDRGYSGIVITDHYFSMFFQWFEAELSGASHEKIMDRWLRGYYSAKERGEQLGMTVLAGAEVRFNGQINDYLVYGLEPDFFYHAPLLNTLQGVEQLKSVLPTDALIVQAHPFRKDMTVCDPTPLFGIEGYNGGTEPRRNQMAKMYAGLYNKPLTSGSDFHHPPALGLGGIATATPVGTAHDLVTTLQGGAYCLIENGDVKKE